MKKTTIVIGETASITNNLIEKFGLIVVPFVVSWPEMDYFEGNIFEKMREAERKGDKTVPKTSQPSIGTFKKVFEETLKESESVICITISSGVSGAYNSATQAKKMLKAEDQNKVFILDTFNVDTSESLIALKAGELAQEGKSGEEIFKEITEMSPNVYLFSVVESPKWLEANGRINHTLSVLLSQMQKIGMRPILSVKDGLVKPATLKMQAKDIAQALFKQAEEMIKKPLKEGRVCKVAISHANTIEEAEKLKKMFEEKYPQVEVIFISLTDPIIGCHVGPGTLLIGCSIEK
ncbi:MAG: fatty acid kinase fatty acid binding subunit [Patescibacteria group bacterium]|nr:fatty acid kinase fatty acid binding subunit [Patescibacteria group bacterium]